MTKPKYLLLKYFSSPINNIIFGDRGTFHAKMGTIKGRNVPLSPNIILFIGLLKYFSKRYFGLVTENYDIILAGYW